MESSVQCFTLQKTTMTRGKSGHKQKPGTSSMAPAGYKSPSIWTISHCFPRPLTGTWTGSYTFGTPKGTLTEWGTAVRSLACYVSMLAPEIYVFREVVSPNKSRENSYWQCLAKCRHSSWYLSDSYVYEILENFPNHSEICCYSRNNKKMSFEISKIATLHKLSKKKRLQMKKSMLLLLILTFCYHN